MTAKCLTTGALLVLILLGTCIALICRRAMIRLWLENSEGRGRSMLRFRGAPIAHVRNHPPVVIQNMTCGSPHKVVDLLPPSNPKRGRVLFKGGLRAFPIALNQFKTKSVPFNQQHSYNLCALCR